MKAIESKKKVIPHISWVDCLAYPFHISDPAKKLGANNDNSFDKNVFDNK